MFRSLFFSSALLGAACQSEKKPKEPTARSEPDQAEAEADQAEPSPTPAASAPKPHHKSEQNTRWRHSNDWGFWVVVENGFERTPATDFESLPPASVRFFSAYADPDVLCKYAANLRRFEKVAILLEEISSEVTDCIARANVTHLSLSLIDIEEWESLSPLPDMEGLKLGISEPNEKTLGRIVSSHNAKSITDLDLGLAPIDKSLVELRRLPNLTYLTLIDTATTDVGASHIGKVIGLKKLSLNEAAISDSGVRHLSELSNLTYLNLGWTQVTDVAIPDLAKLKSLKTLILTDSKISDAGIKRLERLLPDTEIRH